MRHRVKSTRLNRKRNHLDAMLRNLATSVILYEEVQTTLPKAKLVKPEIERLITLAKKHDEHNAMKMLQAYLTDSNASKKLVRELLERYKDRNSGYISVKPTGYRKGDAAAMATIKLV